MKGDPFETLRKIFEKKNEKSNKRILSQSHSAEKLEGFTLWRQKNQNKLHSAEKTQRGDPIVSFGFVSYDKNGVTERWDPLHYPKCASHMPVQ